MTCSGWDVIAWKIYRQNFYDVSGIIFEVWLQSYRDYGAMPVYCHKFIFSHCCSASLNIQSLEHRRILSDLNLCYKLQHHYCDSSVADFFKVCSTSITRGNGQKLYKEHCSVDVTKNYFFNRVVDIWNCLPSCIVSASSLNSFNRNIKSVDFSKFLTVEV